MRNAMSVQLTPFHWNKEIAHALLPSVLVSRPTPFLNFPVRLIVINLLVATPFHRCYSEAGNGDDNPNLRSKGIPFARVTTFMKISNSPIYLQMNNTTSIALAFKNGRIRIEIRIDNCEFSLFLSISELFLILSDHLYLFIFIYYARFS